LEKKRENLKKREIKNRKKEMRGQSRKDRKE
jgi:hypothetical protein